MSEDLRIGTEAHYEDAQYYDQTYRRRRQDVRFYGDLGERYGGPVLELGVGTGRVAIELARRGIDVAGVDRMQTMLDRAEERLAKEPRRVRERVTLRRGDLRRLALGKRFPLVISPFNVFMHLYTRRDVERALAVARDHLKPRGRLVFDVLLPNPEALARDPNRVYRLGHVKDPRTGKRVRYRESFDYDPVRQVQLITMMFVPESNDGGMHMTPLAHRQFFPAELEALLHYNGFTVEHRWGDFRRGPLGPHSESQIVVARPHRQSRRR